jgi:pathogenesis-related protein 1
MGSCESSNASAGDRVEAFFGGHWYPGRITMAHADGTFDVCWDDGTGSARKRAQEVRAFRDGTAPVVLLGKPGMQGYHNGKAPQAGYQTAMAPKVGAGTPVTTEATNGLAGRVGRGESLIANAEWIAEVLEAHNRLRARHGSPPLQWDPECAQKAQLAADACAARGTLFHSHCKEYGHGQNVFFGTPGHYSAKNAAEEWYKECENPGYYTPGAPGTGHFTQLVWLATTHVGVACDRMGKGYIVANYSPPGNLQPVKPHYVNNVLPRGTPMQTRVQVCKVAKNIVATSLTAEVRELLDSIPHENVKMPH